MRGHYFSLLCLLALLVPEKSLAHSPIPGIGNFYNGILHPAMLPAHVLLLLAVGLFLGQQGIKRVEWALGVFAVATVIGLVMAGFSIGSGLGTVVLVLSAVIGLLVAISPQMPLLWCMFIALFAGLFLGIDSAQEELTGTARLVTLTGSGIAIYFLALYPMALADYFNKKAWQQIAVRILGSWISASSLLVLAFSFSSRQ